MSSIYPPVYEYQDGVNCLVEAEYMNRPLRQLRQRTDYLYDKLQQLVGSSAFESVRIQGVQLPGSNPPVPGDIVYLDPVSKTYMKASATPEVFPVYAWESADISAFAVGMLLTGNVVVTYGKTVFTSGVAGAVELTAMIQSGETYRNGPYYLSSSESGKLTAYPKDIAVYVGHLIKNDSDNYGYVILMPQMKDLWEAHRHRSFVMAAQASGVVETDQVDEYVPDPDTDIHYVRGLLSDAPVNADMRLYVVGDWAGDGEVIYTIIATPIGAPLGSVVELTWTTDDASDNSTVPVQVGYYEREVPIGTKGLKVILERNAEFTDYDTENFLTFGVAPAVWTVTVPTAVKGWLGHQVRAAAVSTVGDCECSIVAMGQLSNPNDLSDYDLTLTVTGAAGSFGAGDVDLWLTGTDLATPVLLSNVGLSNDGVLEIVDLSHVDRDLKFWLMITDRSADGVLAPDTDVNVGDKWTISFNDPAPDFKFDYNIGMDAGLATYYPPVPFDNMVLEMNGITLDSYGKFVAGEGSYLPTPFNLYWLDDHYGAAPFPPEGVVPEYLEKTLELYFVNRRIQSSGIVTSLRPDSGAVVSFVDCASGQPATTGDLKARVQLNLGYADSNVAGYNAVKSIDANGKLRTGPLVEKIVAGTSVWFEQVAGPAGQGTVRIHANTGDTTGEFDDLRLNNAKQEQISPASLFSFTKLLPWVSAGTTNVKSGFTAQMVLPYTLTGNYELLFYITAFGLVSVVDGSRKPVSGLRLTYNVMKDYLGGTIGNNLLSNTVSGTVDQNLELGVQNSIDHLWDYNAYDPFLLHNDPDLVPTQGVITEPFGDPIDANGTPLTAGDLVAIRLERIDNQPEAPIPFDYSSALGFMRMRWRLIAS